jgi:hypothetical protein
MDPTKEQHHILFQSQKICDEDPGNDQTRFQGRKHELYTESPNSPRPKKARQVQSKVSSILIIFFDIKGIVYKEFVLTGQTVNSAYYCNVLWQLRENLRGFAWNFGYKRIGCCIMTTHCLTLPFSPGNC